MYNLATIHLSLSGYKSFDELPFEEFHKKKYSIYLIDYTWMYLFVNDFAQRNLDGNSIVGKSVYQIWKEMPRINFQPIYNLLREGVESRVEILVKSTSPLTGKSVEIKGIPLSDCYYFSVSELPDKEALISELKSLLRRR